MATRPGWIDRAEVVRVTFDPSVVTYESLVQHAKKRGCISPVFTRNDAQQRLAQSIVATAARRSDKDIRWVKDNKYQLSRTPLRFVPMTRAQAARINADVSRADEWLSPLQKRLLKQVRAHPTAAWPIQIGVDLPRALKTTHAIASRLK